MGANEPGPRLPAQSVLVVDDEPEVLSSTILLIRSLGYSGIPLDDASRIVEVAQREQPGLILQDLRMKGISISGLVASLRSNPATADIPLVFFSASEDLPAAAARYDVWGFLPKPFSQRELEQLLRTTLGSPGQEPRAPRPPTRPDASPTQQVREEFHEYWNFLAGLSNYAELLSHGGPGNPVEAQAARGLKELLLKLEARTDHLRTFCLSMAKALEADATNAPVT